MAAWLRPSCADVEWHETPALRASPGRQWTSRVLLTMAFLIALATVYWLTVTALMRLLVSQH